jgi:hypothetical protein
MFASSLIEANPCHLSTTTTGNLKMLKCLGRTTSKISPCFMVLDSSQTFWTIHQLPSIFRTVADRYSTLRASTLKACRDLEDKESANHPITKGLGNLHLNHRNDLEYITPLPTSLRLIAAIANGWSLPITHDLAMAA